MKNLFFNIYIFQKKENTMNKIKKKNYKKNKIC